MSRALAVCGCSTCSVALAAPQWVITAGFDVVGVDIKPQPHYPFKFIESEVLAYLRNFANTNGSLRVHYHAIHASPPCQAHTKARKLQGNEHPDLIGPTRELLDATGLLYVIENVKGAPLHDPVVLEGQMFPDLNVHRPRLFETNWPLDVPALIPPPPRQTKMGRPPRDGEAMQIVGHFSDVPAGRRAMGIDWMTQGELAEAIPPAYTEFIGRQLWHRVAVAARPRNRIESRSRPQDHPRSPDGPRHEPGAETSPAALDNRAENSHEVGE